MTYFRKTPRDYQKDAINAVVEGFKTADRGQLIMPCGTGKTLISLWIYETMKPRRAVILFPSLSLLRQTKDEWKKNAKSLPPYLCICSESTIDSSKDEVKMDIKEVDNRATNDIEIIQRFAKENSDFVLFCTYHSSKLLLECRDIYFDLAICDEAHKIAGFDKTLFSIINDNSLINCHKRLYMTATPKTLKKYKTDQHISFSCMSNEKIYGSIFYKMSFGEAISLKILTDYEIILIGIKDDDLYEKLNNFGEMKLTKCHNNFALNKAMKIYNINQVISFHSSINRAKQFLNFNKELFEDIKCYHVSGSQTTLERNNILKEFSKSTKSIITNARCLTEGVDVPSVDAVFFSDPKGSNIDIIQATGRAIRNKRDKLKAYIIIPLYHRYGDNIEDVTKSSKFFHVISVIRALGLHDERILESYRGIKIHGSQHEISEGTFNPIRLVNFEKSIEEKLFFDVINRISYDFLTFEEARSYVHSLKIDSIRKWIEYCKSGLKPANIPANPVDVYASKGWINWIDWLGTERQSPNKKFLKFEDAREIVQSLRITSVLKFDKARKEGKFPQNMPSRPNSTYKDKGWTNWGEFFGFINHKRGIRTGTSYKEAREFAKTLNFKCSREWFKYARSGKLPNHIPRAPDRAYNNKGWVSWSHFLGCEERLYRNRKLHFTYEEAREFAIKLNLRNKNQWNKYNRSGKRNIDIPWDPEKTYKNFGWISWSDFLGIDKENKE